MLRKLTVAAAGGMLASFGSMLLAGNQPTYWLRALIAPSNRPTGFDVSVHDRYFIVDPALLLVNFGMFRVVLYALGRLGSAGSRDQGKSPV
jgi:hypothetical protein